MWPFKRRFTFQSKEGFVADNVMMTSSPFEILPVEVLYQILEKLPVRSLPAVSRVSRIFYNSCQDERLWRREIIKFDPSKCDEIPAAAVEDEHIPVPSPRLCHTCVVWNDSMWAHGGHNTLAFSQVFSEIKNDLWRFKFDERKWERVPVTSCPHKTEHSAVVYDSKMWLFGGYSGEFFTNTLYYYDFITNECHYVDTTGDIPTVRSAHTGVVYRDKMYIFGGWNGTEQNNELYSFEFATRKWAKVNCKGVAPLPRCSHSAVVSERHKSMFVFAGYGGKSQRYLSDLCQFNFETETWAITTNTLPSPRSRMRLVELQDRIYVYGGWNKDEHFNNLYQYDVDKKRWRELKLDMEGDEGKIGQHSMVVFNNILYIFAGYNSTRRTSTNDLYAYRLCKPQQAV